MQNSVPCSIFRGGTSRGLFLLEKDLPPAGAERNALLLRLMGSPDLRQIDGLGGAASVTSKVAILAPSAREDADVDYTFAQVAVDKPIVSYDGNCGNISSAVGPFAIESGLVKADSVETLVRIFNTNTKKIILEKICTPGGQVKYDGECIIDGVPGSAAPIRMIVMEPAGSVFSAMLPTGNTVDILNVDGFGPVEASIVDVSNPLVFVRADALELTGQELPFDIDQNPDNLALLEKVRGTAAKLLGLVEDAAEAAWKTPGVPKMTIIAGPADYINTGGTEIRSEQIDLIGRMMSMQKAHPTYAMTGALCTAAAAVIPGTLVNQVKRRDSDSKRLRIGHPGGIMEAGVDYAVSSDNGGVHIECAYGFRTARYLIKGTAFF
jgi:hypothetical protein